MAVSACKYARRDTLSVAQREFRQHGDASAPCVGLQISPEPWRSRTCELVPARGAGADGQRRGAQGGQPSLLQIN